MRLTPFLLFLALLVSFSWGCNRPANKVVQAEPKKTYTKPNVEDYGPITEREVGEDVQVGAAYTKGSSPQRPRFTIDPETGEKIPVVVVELRQTPCLADTCPDFTVQLMADYTLRYYGRANVDLLGEFTGEIKFNPWLKLGSLFYSERFDRMEEQYPVAASDMSYDAPYVQTTIDYRGIRKTVKNYQLPPPGLTKIENEILSWVDRAIWTPIE